MLTDEIIAKSIVLTAEIILLPHTGGATPQQHLHRVNYQIQSKFRTGSIT